jgi:3-phosphoshikimate 1-carboxyvinyltransferase
MNEFPAWPAPLSSKVSAKVLLPGSKSLTNRELVLSALAEEPTELISPLVSRDTELMIASLKALGTKFSWQGSDLLVTPGELLGPARIDCGLAGTVMRFVPPLSMLVDGEVSFDGDAGARARPMKTTIESMQALGAEVTSDTNSLPFTVNGTGSVVGGTLTIDASASSQFVSGLLLSAAYLRFLTSK